MNVPATILYDWDAIFAAAPAPAPAPALAPGCRRRPANATVYRPPRPPAPAPVLPPASSLSEEALAQMESRLKSISYCKDFEKVFMASLFMDRVYTNSNTIRLYPTLREAILKKCQEVIHAAEKDSSMGEGLMLFGSCKRVLNYL